MLIESTFTDPISVTEPGSHPLDASTNPLVRTVPQFARQFQHDAQQAAAAWLAAQHWFETGKVGAGPGSTSYWVLE